MDPEYIARPVKGLRYGSIADRSAPPPLPETSVPRFAGSRTDGPGDRIRDPG